MFYFPPLHSFPESSSPHLRSLLWREAAPSTPKPCSAPRMQRWPDRGLQLPGCVRGAWQGHLKCKCHCVQSARFAVHAPRKRCQDRAGNSRQAKHTRPGQWSRLTSANRGETDFLIGSVSPTKEKRSSDCSKNILEETQSRRPRDSERSLIVLFM